MLTLIENGEVFAPRALGRQAVLLVDSRIGKVGAVDRRAVEAVGVECELVDASGCCVCPGLIDPHEHLLGGSGEEGFSTQTPEIFLAEIACAGITTVVGTLGVDVTMKTLPGLLAKAKGLCEEGLDAHVWTGGYNVPPRSIMAGVRDDIMFISEVIGVGEVAIADERGMDPDPRALARIVKDSYIGGMLARKSRVTHFHVGSRPARLAVLREIVERFSIEPAWLYPTHVERNEALMREAIDLARAGATADVDVVEGELARWLRFWLDNGGDPSRLTISSDASIGSPRMVHAQLAEAITRHGFPLEQLLPMVTANTARVLGLPDQGALEEGKLGDVVLLDRGTLAVRDVWSRGVRLVRDGALVKRAAWLGESKREIHLTGGEAR